MALEADRFTANQTRFLAHGSRKVFDLGERFPEQPHCGEEQNEPSAAATMAALAEKQKQYTPSSPFEIVEIQVPRREERRRRRPR